MSAAAEIAAALDGARRSGAWWRCICPLHGSRTGRSLTLALRDHTRGLAVHCHAGCSRNDILAELRHRGLIAGDTREGGRGPEPIELARRRGAEARDRATRINAARSIWNAAKRAHGTPVVAYLLARGITLSSQPSLRWAPALRRPEGTYGPAMVARIDGIDGELIGISRTWLARGTDGAWRRRDRAMLGPVAGGAVRLATAAEVLMVGEGIESCLAAMQAMGQPAWAALSTSGLAALALPPIVRHVVILADNDASGAGERAARIAATRWLAEGRRVRLAMPAETGTDFNDVLIANLEPRRVAA